MAGHLRGNHSRGRRLNAKLDENPLFLLYGSLGLLPLPLFISPAHTDGLIECDNSYCSLLSDRSLEREILSDSYCIFDLLGELL